MSLALMTILSGFTSSSDSGSSEMKNAREDDLHLDMTSFVKARSWIMLLTASSKMLLLNWSYNS